MLAGLQQSPGIATMLAVTREPVWERWHDLDTRRLGLARAGESGARDTRPRLIRAPRRRGLSPAITE